MVTEMLSKIRRSLIKHEDYKTFPYIDTKGKVTIGIGFNLSDRGLPDEWINDQFLDDVYYFYTQLNKFSWFKDLNKDRQIVLIDMSFMGFKKFLGFRKMIDALEHHNYYLAAQEMLDSEWALEVSERANELSHAMLTGIYDI